MRSKQEILEKFKKIEVQIIHEIQFSWDAVNSEGKAVSQTVLEKNQEIFLFTKDTGNSIKSLNLCLQDLIFFEKLFCVKIFPVFGIQKVNTVFISN